MLQVGTKAPDFTLPDKNGAPVRLSDRAVCLAWLGALLVCLPLAVLLFGRFPVEWTPRPAGEQAGWEETTAHLLDLGVPAEVAADLAPEDLADCAESVRAVVEQKECPMNKGRKARQTEKPSSPGIMISSSTASKARSPASASACRPSPAANGSSPLLRK